MQVERKTGKVRRPETDVLPLCHATNLNEHVFMRYDTTRYSYSARDRGAEHCDERARVCVCLSVRDHIFRTARPIFTKCFVHVTYGRGSVLLWRRYVLPLLLVTSYLLISQGCSTLPPS